MTKAIRSGAFQFVNDALGLTGEGAQTTELDDGFASQVLEIQRIAAYSQAIGPSVGMLSSVLEMTHAAAGDVTETMDPYNPGVTVGPFTQVEISDFDMWYFGSAVKQISSTQTIDNIQVYIDGVGFNFINEGQAAAVQIPLGNFGPNLGTNVGFGNFHRVLGQEFLFALAPFGPFLWPRGQDILTGSQTTGAGASVIRVVSLWAMCNRALKPSVI